MAAPTLLRELQSLEVFKLEARGPGVYIQQMLTEGNSILSSVFVYAISGGASVTVEYFDTSTGTNFGEQFTLQAHPTLTSAPQTSRITVTRVHNKPYCRATVTGGSVTFGVFATIVSSFASDLDAALVYDLQTFNAVQNKGMPAAAVGSTDGLFHLLRVNAAGELITSASGTFTTTPTLINKRIYGTTAVATPAVNNAEIIYTVPALKKFTWLSGKGSSDADCKWVVDIDSTYYLTRRNSHIGPDVTLDLGNPIELSAGQTLTVTTRNRSIFGTSSSIESWIYGIEETA